MLAVLPHARQRKRRIEICHEVAQVEIEPVFWVQAPLDVVLARACVTPREALVLDGQEEAVERLRQQQDQPLEPRDSAQRFAWLLA